MVKTTAELNGLVRKLVRRLEAEDIPVERILIWGRYATGGAIDRSDIKLIVVSAAFRDEDSMFSKQAILSRTASDLDVMIMAGGYTPEELRDARGGSHYVPLLHMIIGEAREIYPTPLKTSQSAKARHV
jgi:hypothetical protein